MGPSLRKKAGVSHFLLSALIVLVPSSCSIDQGIEPRLAVPTIRGQVYFTGDRPQNTEWVVVVASRDFPPSNIVELAQSQSNFLRTDSDTADYEIILPAFGNYAAVGAVWKAVGEPLALSDVLGIFGVPAGEFALPDTVTVSPPNPIAADINIEADYSVVNKDAVIRGRIHYSGEWPGDTEIIALALYHERPSNPLEFINFAAISLGLPLNVDSYDYRLATPRGTYGYLVLLWLAKGKSILEFEELAFHETQPGSDIPGTITVAVGDTARGVDIFVDFEQFR